MAFYTKGGPDSLAAQLGSDIGEQFSQSLQNQINQNILSSKQSQQANALAKILGLEDEEISQFGKLSPEQQKLAVDVMKQEMKQTPKQTQASYNKGLNIIEEQRKLLKTGHLGPAVGLGKRDILSTFSKEGRKSRAKYEQLGKSLISMASNIPIRNRIEFETLANKLFDPTMDQGKIEGVLDAMQVILEQGLTESGQERRTTNEDQISKKVMMVAPDGSEKEVPRNEIKYWTSKGAKLKRG